MFITHDESTFNANDGKCQYWLKKREQRLRPNGRGKGITVSGLLTPGGNLRVPDHISHKEFSNNSSWPRINERELVREATEYLEYGKDNY